MLIIVNKKRKGRKVVVDTHKFRKFCVVFKVCELVQDI